MGTGRNEQYAKDAQLEMTSDESGEGQNEVLIKLKPMVSDLERPMVLIHPKGSSQADHEVAKAN